MKPRYSPWGPVQTCDELAKGLLAVSTAGHGGIYVPAKQLHRIRPEWRAYAARWSGSEQWYEEDCAWALVALSIPEAFDASARGSALSTLSWLEREGILVPARDRQADLFEGKGAV